MKMLLILSLAASAAVLCAQESETKIGSWSFMKVYVAEKPGSGKSWRITASDNRAINYVSMSGKKIEELKELQSKLDDTMTGLQDPAVVEREKITKLGNWFSLSFSITQKPESPKSWNIFAADGYVINAVHMSGSKVEDLQKLRGLIDETISEMEKK